MEETSLHPARKQFGVSYPFARKKAKGWGTGGVIPTEGESGFVESIEQVSVRFADTSE
jgi:hypothetical protein